MNTIRKRMNSLRKDLFKIVYDSDIESLMDNIALEQTFKDLALTDDGDGLHGEQSKDYLRKNHFLAWATINSVFPIIVNRYILPEWPDARPVMIEHKLNEGRNDGNVNYHNDKISGDFGVYADIDIICLYYFNTLDKGPICVKYDDTGKVFKHYPTKGSLIMLNEIKPGIEHKIEDYNWQKHKRYTARLGFKLE